MGLFSSSGSKRAARAQIRAAQIAADAQEKAQLRAIEERNKALEESRGFIDPLLADDPGLALNESRGLSGALGQEAQGEALAGFEEGPLVQFLRGRGEEAINRNAAAVGGLGSTDRAIALSEFNQGLALQSFQQNLDNLAKAAGIDIGLAGDLASFRTGLGSANAASQAAIGDAQAQGAINVGNAQAQKELAGASTFDNIFGGILGGAAGGFLQTGTPQGALIGAAGGGLQGAFR